MKTFFTLFKRELTAFFYSPITYVVLFYFLFLAGGNFWFIMRGLNGQPIDFTIVEVVFSQTSFWFPFILSFPLITMRVYSEEYRMGTLETLTTAPVKDWQIVLAKFAGVMFFYCVLWTPSFLAFATFKYVRLLSEPNATGSFVHTLTRVFLEGDSSLAQSAGVYWTTFLLLFMMGLFFCSVGLFASALTKDQMVAATISFSMILICVFLPFLPMILQDSSPALKEVFAYFSPTGHMEDYSKGIIDSRSIVWYLSMTALMTYLTLQVFQYRKWKA